ncbi:MAG: synthase protein [Desulfomicrobiaceae bacterium]|nr:AtpZ/AtpI family protein [Desulfomicrobiaceae bacterium]MDK2873440.1 synthase protein [Desulfomicrobiaceae bacterium]
MFFGKKKNDFFELLGMASVMGIHLVSGVIVGLVMGYYLDKWLGTRPWLLVVFLIFGIIAGYRNMFREMQRIQRKEKDAARH